MTTHEIWALGGSSRAAPRDTLPAYWGALGAGAEGLVLDVHLTSDGAVVCAPGDSLEASTGKKATIRVMDFVRYRDGKVAEHWNIVDMAGLMQQLAPA